MFQTFKIKKPIDNWAGGDQNLGLLLTISGYDENKLISVFNDTNQGIFRTFAVLNIHQNGNGLDSKWLIILIDTKIYFVETNKSQIHNETITEEHANAAKTILLNPTCSKRPWHLDFKQLHWNNFILYPENGIMAYQCSGKCHLDNDNHHINNHVKLRQANGYHGFREKVCCVPTEYHSFPIMYLDRVENVVLKNYDEVIVGSCGCR